MSIPPAPQKPLLLYDGECRFCSLWVTRWRQQTQGSVDFSPSQNGAGEPYGFSSGRSLPAVQLVDVTGEIHSGGAAVFALMALIGSLGGRAAWWSYKKSSLVRGITERGYRLVADHRQFFSLLTRFFWGEEVCRPSYGIATAVFLRLLALTFGAAFAGLWWQIDGLIGPRGILPAGEFLGRVTTLLGEASWRELPTLFWLTGCSMTTLQIVCAAGTLLSLGLLLGMCFRWQGAPFLLLEILYLSLVNVGQIFMGYQWDALLLETGFLAVFLAPWPWCKAWPSPLSKTSRWLLLWLLFRLLFSSALVKWLSGDSSWRDFSALDYHFWTQPLPTPGGWFAAQLPEVVLRMMTFGMFVIEFGAPWLLFGPRRLRLLGTGLIALLQLLILLTGNYGFFNLLTLALCLLVVDDHSMPRAIATLFSRKWGSSFASPQPSRSFGIIRPLAITLGAATLFLLSLVPLPLAWIPKTELMTTCYEKLAPFHLVNGYGLFAVMTKERAEIMVEGSLDGRRWKPYSFHFKPGDPNRRPPFIPLFMPRLDWQMWFAALGPAEGSPWFSVFMLRLLQGERSVLHLLAEDPFSGAPPRFVRARLEEEHFSSPRELFRKGLWWVSRADGNYFPTVELKVKERGR